MKSLKIYMDEQQERFYERGIITDEEFEQKKAEFLSKA